jgi:hypothetical protein
MTPQAGSTTPHGYTPNQIRTAYNLPQSGGAGKIIAIVDAYHTPNLLDAYNTFCNTYNLPDNTTGNLLVYTMPGTYKTDSDWAMETCLDVQWAHAIAPNATILLVEANDNTGIALFAAVEYATNYPGVVAVSMSWGGSEHFDQLFWDQYFDKEGIEFFASSGDHSEDVLYPAGSANVVAVGGTTLNLNPDGTVISETAWTGSGGGVSDYEPQPDYQAYYGLNYTKRAVPDVSYNADPSTGVPVCYNGLWYQVGGTSAGAPQWAAIHALGLSASNCNFYQKAHTAYENYFRDITTGYNDNYSADVGYDNVTGLGSPLTYKYGTYLNVYPTTGPSGAPITLSGSGFSGNAVNVSYLNTDYTWPSIANNTATSYGNFSLNLNAPDLQQNNPAGDHPAASDSIVFRAQDELNGECHNVTATYTAWRRGLSQIYNVSATGLFGNQTNLSNSTFLENAQTFTVSGCWFNPGTIRLFWDGVTDLGNVTADSSGTFSASIQVPPTTAGEHTIVLQDSSANFVFNVTRLPMVTHDGNNLWHATDFPINLTPDTAVNEIFYRVNGGVVCNVTAHGQPIITAEGADNTLEYWCTWNLNTGSTVETPHAFLGDIKLDKTPPEGTVAAPIATTNSVIPLSLSASDDLSGVNWMRFSNDGVTYSSWEPYATSKLWMLPDGEGNKIVTAQFQNGAGLISSSACTVALQILQPSDTAPPHLTPTPTPTATPTQPSTTQPTVGPTPTAHVPELTFGIVFVMFVLVTLALTLMVKKKQKK